jgi:hypothetical protein
MEEPESSDGALLAAGVVIVLALLGCVVLFLVAG